MKKMDKKMTETLSSLFGEILDSSQKEIAEKFPELKKSLVNILDNSPEDFNLEFHYPIDGVIRSIVAKRMKKSEWDKSVSAVVFIYMNYLFVEQNLLKFVTIKEGSACSADKSRWLVNALVNHFTSGKPIDMTIDEKCYWKPHFWTSEQWIELFDNIKHLYYGGFNEYLLFLQKNWIPIIKTIKAK